MKRFCKACLRQIPEGRIEAIPDVDTCIYCSRVMPRTIADVEVDGPDNVDMVHAVTQTPRGE